MPSPVESSASVSRIAWPAIARTLLVQVLVLLALSCAIIGYLNWSSDANWADFISASARPAQAPPHQLQSPTPVQSVKAQKPCDRRA